MKCPNGTTSVVGSASIDQCTSAGIEVLRRIDFTPSWYRNGVSDINLQQHLKNTSDFWELGGADDFVEPYGKGTYTIGTIVVKAHEVLTATLDMNFISFNLTYGLHYVIAIYVNCKPCPPRYVCDYLQ
jgi:hypothetical protein